MTHKFPYGTKHEAVDVGFPSDAEAGPRPFWQRSARDPPRPGCSSSDVRHLSASFCFTPFLMTPGATRTNLASLSRSPEYPIHRISR